MPVITWKKAFIESRRSCRWGSYYDDVSFPTAEVCDPDSGPGTRDNTLSPIDEDHDYLLEKKATRTVQTSMTTEVDWQELTLKLMSVQQTMESKKNEGVQHNPTKLRHTPIRLIKVLARDETSDRIECEIRNATTAETYTCLSYVWGPVHETRSIILNGSKCKVRENLYHFLFTASSKLARDRNLGLPWTRADHRRGLDFEAATQALWVDALCINQKDTLERNYQVQNMGLIYSNAQQVFAWMGSDVNCENLFRWTNLYDDPSYRSERDGKWFENYSAHIAAFQSNLYWTRAWITQEILRAQYLYFLAHSAAVDLIDIHYHLMERSEVSQRDDRNSWQTLVNMRIQREATPLLRNLALFWKKGCADHRDRVYSVLSISSDASEIKVNYQDSEPELALQVLRRYEKHFCLRHAQLLFRALDLLEENINQHFASFWAHKVPLKTNTCGRCQQPIDLILPNTHRPSDNETWHKYIYCLRCEHKSETKSWQVHHGHIVALPVSRHRFNIVLLPSIHASAAASLTYLNHTVTAAPTTYKNQPDKHGSKKRQLSALRISFRGMCKLMWQRGVGDMDHGLLRVDPSSRWNRPWSLAPVSP